MQPLELFSANKIFQMLGLGLLHSNRSHRNHSHSRYFTKCYADGRQKTARHRRGMAVGSKFVKPQPSAKARERAAKRRAR